MEPTMSKGHGWGLAVLSLAAVLAAAGCDKGGSTEGGGEEGEQGGGGNPLTQRDRQAENMYSGEALLERPELARRDIRGMLDRSRAYYERFNAFPPSAPLTPPEVPCGPEGHRFDASEWQHPTWQALRFEPRDPHNYSYQYDAMGTAPALRFVVTAIGDLDCDGVRSTFQRGATVQADGVIASDPEVTETNRDE
jgi:hypothetical protein